MKILSTLISIFAWIFTSCSTTGVQASSRLRKMKPNSYYSCQMEIDLLDALDKNNFQKADEAITHGAKVNAIGNQEMTPLAWTLGKQNLLAYSYLLEKGANPNFKTKKVAWNNDGQSVMQFAAMCENPEYISLALRHGGNPNAPDSLSDQTILFASIEHRRSNNIRILAKFGADLDHSAKDGSTPLMLCVYQNDFDLALLLLEL